MNVDEESFGTDRLVAICDEHLPDSSTHLLQAIFLAVESFSRGRGPHDDMAAALFYCSESDLPLKTRGTTAYGRLAGRVSPRGCSNRDVVSAQSASGFQLTV
jgi:hypothetical protein